MTKMPYPSNPPKPWRMRAIAVFLALLLSYLTWHAASSVGLLGGCMMLSSVLIELGKFEWARWQLRRARRERSI